MSTTGEMRYRQFDAQTDLPWLASLLAAVEAADHTGEDVREQTLREQLAWPGHDPARDRWVAESTGTAAELGSLIGYGALFKTTLGERADVYVAIHPDRRGQGVGAELLRRVVARARELGATQLGAYAADHLTASDAFLRARGFARVSAYTEMSIAGDTTFPAPQWPDGFTVRPYAAVQDATIFLDTINRSYAGVWGHHTLTMEEALAWLPEVVAEGAFLLFAPDGAVAGICRAEMSKRLSERRGEPTGLVDAPGVVPERRSEGLYLPQTLHALGWLQRQTPAPAGLVLESWGDDPATLDLYTHIGFAVTHREVSYRLDL
ncbi:MAG: GNAT family N-acetyltransferase [Ktedonobacterales bacterium]